MLLYHAGFDIIKNPDIHFGRKNADFGQGFYTTPDKEFAYRWAKEQPGKKTIVNCYELNLTGLETKKYNRNKDWFEYIYKNRHREDDNQLADLIIGPIANDIIYDTLGITTSGYLSKDEAMKLLMIGPEYIQVVLKTEKASSNLKWLSYEELFPQQLAQYHKIMKNEELVFQEIFAKTLENILPN